MKDEAPTRESRKGAPVILLWAVLIACLYLPTLATPYDFIDDGNLVYPTGAVGLEKKAEAYWHRVVANYEHLGPFRPVLWLHWQVEAESFASQPLMWRGARLLWAALAAAALLTLLQELRISWRASLIVTALAMWSPLRNEVWTSLTLSEGVAMPYALAALICALRAARSTAPWRWDVAGALCILAALGCKNTFAAVVPAQIFLRVAPEGSAVWLGFRRNWRAVCLLGSILLFPIAHYIYFATHWHPGQYEVGHATWKQLALMLRAEGRAAGLEFLGVGLVIAGVALGRGLPGWWRNHRAPLLGGALLLIFGTGIYLNLDAVAGRYTMPAVWGLDLWIAVLSTRLAEVPHQKWKTAAWIAIGCGMAGVAIANFARQEKFAARARVLWSALEFIEREGPRDAVIAWIDAPTLNVEEGIHFAWHLRARARLNARVTLLDASGQPLPRLEPAPPKEPARFAFTASAAPPLDGKWNPWQEFTTSYRLGHRHFHIQLWRMAPPP